MTTRVDAPYGVRIGPHLLVFSVGYVVFSYAAVPAVVMARFDVRFTAVGLLMSAALGAFVVVQVVGGRLVDERPTPGILLALGIVHAVLAAGIDLATEFRSLLALRAAWGLAGGLVLTVGATQLSRVYDGERATRQEGIYGAALTLGGAVAFVLTPTVVDVTGWIGVHAVGGVASIPALIALWASRGVAGATPSAESPIGSESPTDASGDRRSDAAGDRRSDAAGDRRSCAPGDGSSGGADSRIDRSADPNPLLDRLVLLAAGCYVATLGAYVTLSTFVTAFFDDLGVAAPLNAVALLAASLGRAGGGVAVTHPAVDDGRLIAATTGIGAAGLVALAMGNGVLLLALPLVVLATVSLPFGAIFKVAAAATRRDASALAIVVAAGNVGALVLPTVTGRLRDVTGGYDAAFLLLAAVNAVAVLAGIAIARRGPDG